MKSLSVTIQMKASEQYFPVVQFIMLYKVVQLLSLWMKYQSVTIQMKVTEQFLFSLYSTGWFSVLSLRMKS